MHATCKYFVSLKIHLVGACQFGLSCVFYGVANQIYADTSVSTQKMSTCEYLAIGVIHSNSVYSSTCKNSVWKFVRITLWHNPQHYTVSDFKNISLIWHIHTQRRYNLVYTPSTHLSIRILGIPDVSQVTINNASALSFYCKIERWDTCSAVKTVNK